MKAERLQSSYSPASCQACASAQLSDHSASSQRCCTGVFEGEQAGHLRERDAETCTEIRPQTLPCSKTSVEHSSTCEQRL